MFYIMAKFENISNFSGKENTPQSDVAKYWAKFNFPFKPPKSGSPVEARLEQACNDYAKFILDPNRHGAVGSEGERRLLHDQLAIMTVGKNRIDLDTETAEEIADFACLVATGMKADEAFQDFNKHRSSPDF